MTDRLLGMKAWDSDLEEEEGEEGGEKETSNGRAEENGKGDRMDTQGHLQKVQKLIYAAKVSDLNEHKHTLLLALMLRVGQGLQ